MRTLSARNSTGYELLAPIPPTFAAASITSVGLRSNKVKGDITIQEVNDPYGLTGITS
jgi:hypothetical protein